MILGRIRDLLHGIENHVDMLDDLNEKAEGLINAVKAYFGR